ncbi:MAG: signal transduction histidine kinase [Planctomycetota bacterium]|jgi:signal transduction histidine kinase
MIRGISTKWMLGVLLCLALPLMGFAWFARASVTGKRADEVTRFHLQGQAADLSNRLHSDLLQRQQDVAVLASIPVVHWFVANYSGNDRETFRQRVERVLDGMVAASGVYSRIFLVDRAGDVVAWNLGTGEGRKLTQDQIGVGDSLFYGDSDWFKKCLNEGFAVIDFHRPGFVSRDASDDEIFHVGFAANIDPLEINGESPGVVVAFMEWNHVQQMVNSYGVRRLSEGGRGNKIDIFASSYAWIWGRDADTILAHKDTSLYGQRVSGLEGGKLKPLVDAARDHEYGMYPEYNFQGVKKRAAFHRMDGPLGLQWVFGVGVDDKDIYGPVREQNALLMWASVLSLVLGGALAWWLAKRMTRPILELKRQAEEVAAGDLQARVKVRGKDEMAQLSVAFNSMAHNLAENRDRLVKAEKESAWREMALQVAHEIKNPLTPIRLSVGLLRRAWKKGPEAFEPILETTLQMIDRQVDAMREVTRDFSDFAGTDKPARPVVAGSLLIEVLDWAGAWAGDLGVEVVREGFTTDAYILVHEGEMRRAFLNLVSNALESMQDGGVLTARMQVSADTVCFTIQDSGSGITDSDSKHLFEPHFTTRSGGTGLGLAIVKRVVESRSGTIRLENVKGGVGAIATLTLPALQLNSDGTDLQS